MLLMSSCSATGAYDKIALGMSWASQCAQTPLELTENISIDLVVVFVSLSHLKWLCRSFPRELAVTLV